jgi:hypothetical protein
MPNSTKTQQPSLNADSLFAFNLDALRADAVASVQNPLVRAAILRVKHGQAAQGFTHGYDKAYHSHSST